MEDSVDKTTEDVKKQCWECLKRRIVCDFGRPKCKKCTTRRVECPGYSNEKPVKWLLPGQTRAKGRLAKLHVDAVQPAMRDWSETTDVMEAIQYFNENICPDLTANGAGGGFRCPFTVHLSEATYLPPAARQTMVSIALAHRILKSEQGFKGHQAQLCKKLQVHRGQAIRHLASNLNPDAEKDDYTLMTILMLLLAEIQQSFSASWRQHCDAANALIDMSGGLLGLNHLPAAPSTHSDLVLRVEIFSMTTSPVVEEHRVRRQLDIRWTFKDVFNVGLHTTVPCPSELLLAIVEISNLLYLSRTRDAHENEAAALNMLRSIQAFSVEAWAAEIIHYDRKSEDPKTPFAQNQALSWDWQAIGHAYKSSILLYCISSLLYSHYTGVASRVYMDGVDIEVLRSDYLTNLLSNLQGISMYKDSRLRKFVTWPLVVSGIEVGVDDASAKGFISRELRWTSKTMGLASPLVADKFLNNLWKSGWIPTGYSRRGWNDIFDRPYIFM